jgi:adenylate cyclase
VLAEAYGQCGQGAIGLAALDEVLTTIEKSGEGVWEAEAHRLKGELVLTESPANRPEAEACFRRAMDVARAQHARSLELRAAVSLSRLLQRAGERDEARRLLAEVYGWFTEGFDTAKEARALLGQLS